MSTIKSLEDLKRAREEALKKRELKASSGTIQVIVGMGTCGIAAVCARYDEINPRNNRKGFDQWHYRNPNGLYWSL